MSVQNPRQLNQAWEKAYNDGDIDALVELYEPEVVDDSAGGSHINQPMKLLPAFTSETANPLLCGSYGEGDHQYEAGEAQRDVRPLRHVFDHRWKIEVVVQPHIRSEVKETVEEAEQTQHPPHRHQGVTTPL